MRVIVTQLADISSKKGQFVKGSFISTETGVTGDFFTSREKFDAFGYDRKKVALPVDLEKLEQVCEVSDVQFDQNGQFVSVS